MNRTILTIMLLALLISNVSASDVSIPSEFEGIFSLFMGATEEVEPEQVAYAFGDLMTSLICRCMEDDTCEDAVGVFCGDTIVIDDPGLQSIQSFVNDAAFVADNPSYAMCAASRQSAGMAPPNIDTLDEIDTNMPEVPALRIEAVSYVDGGLYRYGVRYIADITAGDWDDYEGIELTLDGQRELDVLDTMNSPPLDSDSFPYTASFSNDDLFTEACISFDDAPEPFPDSFCVPIREVDV